MLVNLASHEYFSAVENIGFSVITPVFKEKKGDAYRVVAIHAKRARGAMTQFMVENLVKDVEEIKKFTSLGYSYNATLSSDTEWVFTR